MQVPETLIGTAIGIAILPTLSEMIAREDRAAYQATLQRAMQVIVAITLPIAALLMIGLRPLLETAFGFGAQGTDLLLWTTRGFLIGLTGQCLLEVAVRSFYARQDAITPLVTAGINFGVYVVSSVVLFRAFGAPGISLADSLAFTSQAVLLMVLLNRRLITSLTPAVALPRGLLAALAGGVVVFGVAALPFSAQQPLVMGVLALALGAGAALIPIWKEIRLLLHL
jgi:putative peptidoglycan lipid II flippase